jgi:hypothetical protein
MKAKKNLEEVPPIEVTAEARYHLINDAAYFRSMGHGGPRADAIAIDEQAQSWCEAEAEIDAVLKQHHAK